MSMQAILAAVVLATLTAISGCGGEPAEPAAEPSHSALSVTVGTHRAVGSYTCNLPAPAANITWSVSTMLYLVQRPYPGLWYMDLTPDVNGGQAITVDRVAASPMESKDNGFVVYNNTAATLYVHKLTPFVPIEYSHGEAIGAADVQVWPSSSGHPHGQLVFTMRPQGASDPLKGECPSATTAYLDIQP